MKKKIGLIIIAYLFSAIIPYLYLKEKYGKLGIREWKIFFISMFVVFILVIIAILYVAYKQKMKNYDKS